MTVNHSSPQNPDCPTVAPHLNLAPCPHPQPWLPSRCPSLGDQAGAVDCNDRTACAACPFHSSPLRHLHNIIVNVRAPDRYHDFPRSPPSGVIKQEVGSEVTEVGEGIYGRTTDVPYGWLGGKGGRESGEGGDKR